MSNYNIQLLTTSVPRVRVKSNNYISYRRLHMPIVILDKHNMWRCLLCNYDTHNLYDIIEHMQEHHNIGKMHITKDKHSIALDDTGGHYGQ